MSRWQCPSCDRSYAYDLPVCTWCGVDLEERDGGSGVVTAVTEVMAPSVGHEDVPYWVALIRGEDDALALRKYDVARCVGEAVSLAREADAELASFGVIGTGTMGRGLVELLLSRGHTVVWISRSDASLERGAARVADRLARVMDEEQLAEAISRLSTSVDYNALEDADVVVEAVIEELGPKAKILADAEAGMRPDAILATNTSGLPLDELAQALDRPERFGALHFFNPPTRMRLVETAVAPQTSPATSAMLDELALSLGKTPVRVAATPAFAVNRVLMPLLNEAVRELEEGVAPAASIDDAVRLGLNHPMGPLALADLIGLDVVLEIMGNLAERTGDETYEPRPMLRELVAAGKLGRKTGEGFYVYEKRPTTA
jgi:3-hydroxybutyryl-CoA dehydrogenase